MLGWALEAGGDLERRAGGAAQPVRRPARRPRTIAITGGRSSAPGASRGARPVQARARAGDQPRRDAGDLLPAHALSARRPRSRAARSLALRSAGVGLARCRRARRCRSARATRRGVRLARLLVRLEREPGRRAERAREARHRHRPRRADSCWPADRGRRCWPAPTRATRRAGGHRRDRGRAAVPPRRLSVRRAGGGRRRSVEVHAREHARGPQRAVERSADHRARRRNAVRRRPGTSSCFPRAASCCSTPARRCGSSSIAARGDAREADGVQFLVWGGIDFNLWATPTRVVRARGARRDGWSAAPT